MTKLYRVLVFNTSTSRREYRKFRSQADANRYFENIKSKKNLVCEPKDNYFTYRTEFGNEIMVQKMY